MTGIRRPNTNTANASDPPAVSPSRPLLTVPEVASLLRLTVKGIYAMVEGRRIPFIRVGNRVRFVRDEVLRWLSESRVPASERSR